MVILWDCGSQEPGSNPGPGPSNSSFSPYHDFQNCIYTYKLFSFHLVHVGLIGRVAVEEINQTEKLQEWLDSLPEIVRQRESASVLAFVFFVELLKEKEKEEVSSNA